MLRRLRHKPSSTFAAGNLPGSPGSTVVEEHGVAENIELPYPLSSFHGSPGSSHASNPVKSTLSLSPPVPSPASRPHPVGSPVMRSMRETRQTHPISMRDEELAARLAIQAARQAKGEKQNLAVAHQWELDDSERRRRERAAIIPLEKVSDILRLHVRPGVFPRFSIRAQGRTSSRALLISVQYKRMNDVIELKGTIGDVRESKLTWTFAFFWGLIHNNTAYPTTTLCFLCSPELSLLNFPTVFRCLTDRLGYLPRNILVLAEGELRMGEVHRWSPTKANIRYGMQWLVSDMRPGDSSFFFYAGHGDEVRDVSGDEAGGYDQAIVPLDFATEGFILDDWIHEFMVCNVPRGARLTAVVDSCHSGTVLDLPVNFQYPEVIDSLRDDFDCRQSPSHGSSDASMSARLTSWGPVPKNRKSSTEIGEVLLFSGAADMQKAVDARVDSSDVDNVAWMGVFASCWIQEIKNLYPHFNKGGPGPIREKSFGAVLDAVNEAVSKRLDEVYKEHGGRVKFLQSPQLSASHAMHVYRTPFSL